MSDLGAVRRHNVVPLLGFEAILLEGLRVGVGVAAVVGYSVFVPWAVERFTIR